MEYEVGKKFEEHEALINYLYEVLAKKGIIETKKDEDKKEKVETK
jgi:hypothetical protein